LNIAISQVYGKSSIALGFKPSEITHNTKGGCSHNNNNYYHLKKYEVNIKTTDSEENNTIFSSIAKFFVDKFNGSGGKKQINAFDNLNQTALEQPFEVVYQCNCDKIYCDRIKSSFEKVPGYFTRAIEIYSPIKIRLNVFSFSKSEFRKDNDALAITSPPPYLVLKNSENGWPFSYPVTLIKQLNIDVEIQYADGEDDVDIDIDINTDKMSDHKYFAGMLAHEILHGMGIYYLIEPLSDMLPNFNITPEVVLPPMDINEYDGADSVLLDIKSFLPPSVYEKNFVDLKKMIENEGKLTENYYFFNESYYGAFRDFPLNMYIYQPTLDESEKRAYQQFNESLHHWEGYSIAKNFYKAGSTANSVGFLTNKGEVIKLQTYDNEYSGDLSHISTPYFCESRNKCSIEDETDHHLLPYGPNFVMLSKYYLMGLSAEEKIQLIAPNNTYGLLGDNIVHMLTTMGWTEKGHERNTKKYYVLLQDDLFNLKIDGPVNPTPKELNLNSTNYNLAAVVSSASSNIYKLSNILLFISSFIITFIR